MTYRKIRRFLASRFVWERVFLPRQVFRAVVDTHVLIFRASETPAKEAVGVIVDKESRSGPEVSHKLPWTCIPRDGSPINVSSGPEEQALFAKIRSCSVPLSEVCRVYNGIKPFEKGKGKPPQTAETMKVKPFVRGGPRPGDDWSPLLRGSLIQRYSNLWDEDYWILYGEWLAAPRNASIFRALKMIVVRQTGDSIIATLVEHGFYARDNLHIVISETEEADLSYLLGLMNSRLVGFFYQFMNPEIGEALAQVKKRHVELLPVVIPKEAKGNELAKAVTRLVRSTLQLHRELRTAKTDHDKKLIQRQIDDTDKQIDQLVYELYGLTDNEIRIVKEATRDA